MIKYFSSEDLLISSQTVIQINMQFLIYFTIALVAISSAQQFKNGPQILPEKPSSSEPSQTIGIRQVNQEFNLHFTPEEVQALQALQSQNTASIETFKQNPGIGEESYNHFIQKFYAENFKPSPIKEPQVEQVHSSSNFFLPIKEPVYKPNFNFNTYKQLLMDQTKLSRHAQNLQKNKLNQLEFFKPAAESNKNDDQKKSVVKEEKEYILRNGDVYKSGLLNYPIQVRFQNSGQKKSAFEKEIEDAWRQYHAYELKRLNSPAEINEQILPAGNKNQKKIEVKTPIITYFLRNDQAYEFERSNDPSAVNNNQGSQGRNEGQEESEVAKEIKNLWSKQPDHQFQKSLLPDGVFNQNPSAINENKKKTEVDKQIENIFRHQNFERSYSPALVSHQKPSDKNKNLENWETEKQLEFILSHHDNENDREEALEIKQSPLITNADKNKSDEEKEIQSILKKHQDSEYQRSKLTAEAINRSPPVQIHEHVSITKHIPVPTPVLVPIPQPYEVKVPHFYPVPLKVVKQYS